MKEPDLKDISNTTARLTSVSAQLQSLDRHQLAEAIASAARLLSDDHGELGQALRTQLEQSGAISRPMIDWGLATALNSANLPAVLRTAAWLDKGERYLAVPVRLATVILSGNVFTASLRALALPILAGVPVIAKTSETDDILAHFFKRALDQVNPTIGAACEVVTFSSHRTDLLDALYRNSEVVAVYGSNQTVEAVRAALPSRTRLVPHGHGLGAIYLHRQTLSTESGLREAIAQIAVDVAAYDQRGCLSPHFILLESGAMDGREFAVRLADQGLKELEKALPLGHLSIAAGAAQLQWRAVAAVRGTLFLGESYAVSFEEGADLRPSPGFRNVAVYNCPDRSALAQMLRPFGEHLKALGIAGDRRPHGGGASGGGSARAARMRDWRDADATV